MKQRYEQINLITFIAMIMIFTIHYFNNYAGIITSNSLLVIVSVLRGMALIAVPLYVANIGYSYVYLHKEVKFNKIFIYIVLPTLFLTQINIMIGSGQTNVFWNTKEGFSNSWFADMFIPLMLLVPLIQYLYNKNEMSKKILVILSCFGLAYSYIYSLGYSATLLGLGIWVFIPYISMLIVLTYFIFDVKIKSRLLLIFLFSCSVLLIGYGYYSPTNPNIPKLVYFNSYFGPLATVGTIGLFQLVYHSDWRIPKLRLISQSSYFFYFVHHGVLKIYRQHFNDLVESHVLRFYVIGIILSLIISTIIFKLYDEFLVIMKINPKATKKVFNQ